MAQNYTGHGEVLMHTAAADIANGAVVVVGQTLGVAMNAIKSGETGAVATEGEFSLPKVSGAVIKQGETLTWDVSAGAFDDNAATAATGDVTGPTARANEDAGNGVTALKVYLTGIPGTVKAAT